MKETDSPLGTLGKFSERGQPPPEVFGAGLQAPHVKEVVAYCEEDLAEAAERYARVVGIGRKTRLEILQKGTMPREAALELRGEGRVPLIIDSATNSGLHERFFTNPDPNVHYLVDHHYRSDPSGGDRLHLVTVGTTVHGLDQANADSAASDQICLAEQERNVAMGEDLGKEAVHYHDFRRILRSSGKKFRLHALGPEGTNIAQVSRQYAAAYGPQDSEIIVHPAGVEPVQYSQIAHDEASETVLPGHTECAVYYHMGKLYSERELEQIFADHRHMPLIPMVLGTRDSAAELLGKTSLRFSSHPSPRPLVQAQLDSGKFVYEKATSNAVAAEEVAHSKADICITTRQALQNNGLIELHNFGSPNMLFTVGTPLTSAQLRSLRRS